MTAQHPHLAPQQKQRSTSDVIATIATALLAVIAGFLALSLSIFFPMAADPCGSNNCNTDAIGWGYLVTWVGVGVAAIVAIGGIVLAALRRRRMWVWPTVALVLIIVATVIGSLLVGSVTPHH
jgi:uncharacterized BrkB/YihY/UPF0761 family membrane protein